MKIQHWLSFSDENTGECNGVCIVETDNEDIIEAVKKTWDLEINPGGQVMDCECSNIDSKYLNRLLSAEEAKNLSNIS